MRFSGLELLIILGVVLLFFGPKRLPGLGNALGSAIRGFKKGISGSPDEPAAAQATAEKPALPERSDQSPKA